MNKQCVFCQIVAGDSPASIVYKDHQVTAFLDIRPVSRGHTLLIPNEHSAGIADLAPSTGGYLFGVALGLSEAVRESVNAEGMNLFLADGEVAGQEVLHFHLHVIPRREGDGFGLRFPPGYPHEPERRSLEDDAKAVRQALRAMKSR